MPRPSRLVGSRPGLRPTAVRRASSLLQKVVLSVDDRRLERVLGSPTAQRVLFGLLASAYMPERGAGLTGELCFEVRRSDGAPASWTLVLGPAGARARAGVGHAPLLTVKAPLAALVHVAAGELDPGDAVLTGQVDLEGDFALAMRLGELFGRE